MLICFDFSRENKIFDWITFALATPFVFTRVYVQVRRYHRPWRELFIVAAWIFFLVFTACYSVLNDVDSFNFSVDADAPDHAAASALGLKIWFLSNLVYLQILYACKMALLCFYNDLVAKHVFPRIWWAIRVTGVMILLSSINDFTNSLVTRNYSQIDMRSHPGLNIWSQAIYPIHLFTDVIVYIIPFFILRPMPNVHWRKNVATYGLFALGLINILNAAAVMIWAYTYKAGITSESSFDTVFNTFLFTFHPFTGIVIVCLPYCRRMWKDIKSGRQEVGEKTVVPAVAITDVEAGASHSPAAEEPQVDRCSADKIIALDVVTSRESAV